MDHIAIEELVSTEDLLICWMPGRSDRCVVVFTGIRHNIASIPLNEFAGSVSDGGAAHVLFVTDLNCTWYSRRDLVRRIEDTITGFVAERGITDLRTMGNSMGGYGAMLLAERLNARVALSMSPQVSMDETVISEPRWRQFRPLGPDLSLGLQTCLPGPETMAIAVFGRNDMLDRAQAALLPASQNLHVFMVGGCTHDAVKHFKSAGFLQGIVRSGLAGDLETLSGLLRQFERANHRPVRDVFTWLRSRTVRRF